MVETRHFAEDRGGATRDAIDAILGGEAAAVGHPAPFRRRRIGRALLAEAETLARERRLVGVWLDTAAFQAPDYFPPLGYSVFGRLPDFPPGKKRLFFLKRLDGGPHGGAAP